MSRPLLLFVCVSLALAAWSVPASAQGPSRALSSGELAIADPVGDPIPFGVTDEPTPAGSLYSHIDLQAFKVRNESPDSYELVLDLVGRTDPATTLAEALALQDFGCYFSWSYDDDRQLGFGAAVYSNFLETPGGGVDSLYHYVYRWGEDYANWDEDDGAYSFRYDAAEHDMVFTFSKSVLTTSSGQPPAKGTYLSPEWVDCYTDVALYGNMGDSVDVRDQGFAFSDPGAGSVVQLAYATPGPIGVTPAKSAIVEVVLVNTDEARRIVSLQADALGSDGASLGWNVTVAPTIDLKAGETRVVRVIVTAPADAAPGTRARIQTDLAVLGRDAPGRAVLPVRVVPQMGPGADTYGFFRTPDPDAPAAAEWPGLFSRSPQLSMSLLPDVEGYTQDPTRLRPLTGTYSYGPIDPLGSAIRLDGEAPAVLTLDLQSSDATEVEVQFRYAIGDEIVVSTEQTLEASGVTTLQLPILSSALTFPAGAPVYFELWFFMALQDGVEAMFHPASSSFRLPLVPVAERELQVSDGRFLPTLSLAPGSEKEIYVNPGKTYHYELVLANEGIETDDLTVSVVGENATGWDIRLVPGRSFRVPAGNATLFGVEITPSASAQDNDHARFAVKAISKHDPVATSTLRLAALVTTNLELPESYYGIKEGQIDPLGEARESSFVPSVLLLGLLLIGFARSRRRLGGA